MSDTPPDIVERLAKAMFRRANPGEIWAGAAWDRRQRWVMQGCPEDWIVYDRLFVAGALDSVVQ